MGCYLETPLSHGKAQQLVELYGAELRLLRPKHLKDVPEGKVLVCVLQNPTFDAAGVCYNNQEMLDFDQPSDYRPKTWLYLDMDKACELNPHTKNYFEEMGD